MRNKSIFLFVLMIVAFVFLLGLGLGNYFGSIDAKAGKILKQSELDAESFLIEQQLIDTFGSNCDISKTRLSALSEQLWQLGKSLDSDSAREELGEEQYNFLKRKYHLMQIKTYSLYKNLENNCDKESDIILFYFNKNNPASKEQGDILDKIAENFDARIFAIEFNYAPEIKFLERYYNIDKAPAIVINFQDTLIGVQDFEVIEEILLKWKKE